MKNFIKTGSALIILLIGIISATVNAQGLINNGAKIVITTGSKIYINGSTGNYTSQLNGIITNDSGSIITLAGNWVNNSSNTGFSSNNSTVVLAGASSQNIGGTNLTAMQHVIIANTSAAGVILGGALDVYGSLTYSGAGMKLTTNDTLTLKSTATNTAWLGVMTGNTIVGKVTVERYISARKTWRFLSIPTNPTQTIKQAWQEGCGSNLNCVANFGTQITGSGGTAAGFDVYTSTPSMKTYDPASNTWVGIPNTNTAGIKATDGYMVFIRGDRTATAFNSTPTQTVLRTKGALYTGNLTSIVVSANNFASIGNPYPSALDMRNITKTGLKDFFYVWDPQLAGSYGYGGYQTFYNSGGNYVITPGGGSYGSIGSINNYIQSGEAFLVQGDVGGGSLTFKENAKASGSSLVTVAATIPQPQLLGSLYGVYADSSTYMADGFMVDYDDSYSNAVDDMDALKLPNTSENLGIKRDNILLVVERRHTITGQDTIFLNFTNEKVQGYRFEFTTNQFYQAGLTGVLEDAYLNTSTPLNIDGTTAINFNIVNIPGSYAANRFMIVFSTTPPVVLPVTFTSLKAYQQGSNINVEWKVDNETNMKQYVVEKSTDGNIFSTMAVTPATVNNGGSASYQAIDTHPADGYNYYRVKSVDVNGATAYTGVAKVLISKIAREITVYPNPIINGTINLQLNNQPSGQYMIKLFNKSGQVIFTRNVLHAQGSSIENIKLFNYTLKGIYQLEVISPDGTLTNINIVN